MNDPKIDTAKSNPSVWKRIKNREIKKNLRNNHIVVLSYYKENTFEINWKNKLPYQDVSSNF